jgi:hypothetical protein
MIEHNNKISRFDQVMILTTKNIDYLSAPPDIEMSPHGVWSVVAAVGDKLMLAKNTMLVKIPPSDVKLIAKHDSDKLTNLIKGLLQNGEKRKERKKDPQ